MPHMSLAGVFVDSSGELSTWLDVVLGVISLAGGILILVDPGGSIDLPEDRTDVGELRVLYDAVTRAKVHRDISVYAPAMLIVHPNGPPR